MPYKKVKAASQKKSPFHCYKAIERGSMMSDRIGEGYK
jgi:hypothetical protein